MLRNGPALFAQKLPQRVMAVLVWCACALPGSAEERRGLLAEFRDPPASARPYVWWHWMGSNFSTEGITKDLEAMASAGIGGATIFNLTSAVQESQAPTGNNPWPDNSYRSKAYWNALRHACAEGRRLGLEIGLHNTVGYSTTGGPWIDQERGIQQLVWREVEATVATAGEWLSTELPRPEAPKETGWGSTGRVMEFYRDIAVLAFPADRQPVDPANILVLPPPSGADSLLKWHPPAAGEWILQRVGHAPTGVAPHPVPDECIGKVLEADKISLEQTRFHWEQVLGPIAHELGEPVGRHLGHFLIDSYEAGHQSWTPGLREEFQRRFGYDLLPWLITRGSPLTGEKKPARRRIVGDPDQTARFEYDFRRFISDLYHERGWQPAAERIRAAGATLQFEPYGGPFDTLDGAALADLPMGEFWTSGHGGIDPRIVGAARAAGRRTIGAEAFTGRPEISQWTETPAFLKASADGTFASGVNRMVLHHWVHQPFDDRYQPGMGMGWWGTHFGRHQSWFEDGREFFRYLWRVQALLQRGETPVSHLTVGQVEAGGDAVSWRAFREEITVRERRVVTRGGRSYPLLHVPHSGSMEPADVERLTALVEMGAMVVSPRPTRAPGLSGYPEADARVKAMGLKLWGREDLHPQNGALSRGEGALFPHGDLAVARRHLGLRDFASVGGDPDGKISIHHRRDGKDDWIFLANRDSQPRAFSIEIDSGAVDSRKAELWDAETGLIHPGPAPRIGNYGLMAWDLRLGAGKSIFLVLPNEPSPGLREREPADEPSLTRTVAGPWQVDFLSPVDKVASIEMPELIGLHEHKLDSIRHLAGKAIYATRFDHEPSAPRARLFLDLGGVEALARVQLNGIDLGVLWHPPFRVEVTDALRAGGNDLRIEVSTTWHNRLAGDERHPADFTWGKDRGPTMGRALGAYPDWFLRGQSRPESGRKGFVTWFYHREDTPLRPSGLLGPVTLRTHPAPGS